MTHTTDVPAEREELLPCPFCGEEPHLHEPAFVGDDWQVGCQCGDDEDERNPGAIWRNGKTFEEVAARWNRRAAPQEAPSGPALETREPELLGYVVERQRTPGEWVRVWTGRTLWFDHAEAVLERDAYALDGIPARIRGVYLGAPAPAEATEREPESFDEYMERITSAEATPASIADDCYALADWFDDPSNPAVVAELDGANCCDRRTPGYLLRRIAEALIAAEATERSES